MWRDQQRWQEESWRTIGRPPIARGEKASTPTLSALRANFGLTKDLKSPCECQFSGKIDREGSCSKAVGSLRKDESAIR